MTDTQKPSEKPDVNAYQWHERITLDNLGLHNDQEPPLMDQANAALMEAVQRLEDDTKWEGKAEVAIKVVLTRRASNTGVRIAFQVVTKLPNRLPSEEDGYYGTGGDGTLIRLHGDDAENHERRMLEFRLGNRDARLAEAAARFKAAVPPGTTVTVVTGDGKRTVIAGDDNGETETSPPPAPAADPVETATAPRTGWARAAELAKVAAAAGNDDTDAE